MGEAGSAAQAEERMMPFGIWGLQEMEVNLFLLN